MKAKLLGAVSAAVLLCSVGIANAQGPMQLTDTQLDVVTAGAGNAFASAFATNGNVDVAIQLRSRSDSASATLVATNFVNTENGPPFELPPLSNTGVAGTFNFVVQAGGPFE